MIKVKSIANSDFEIKKIIEQAKNSVKAINNCIKNSENNLDIDENNLLKTVYGLKGLKFMNLKTWNKILYRELEEEGGIYKGIIRLKQIKF